MLSGASADRDAIVFVVIVGVGGPGCYLIILFALRLAYNHAGYVVALRECSVVFGVLFGVVLLRERLSSALVFGVLCIVVGLVLIKSA